MNRNLRGMFWGIGRENGRKKHGNLVMLWKFKHVYQTSLNMARLKNKSKTMLKSMAYHHPN